VTRREERDAAYAEFVAARQAYFRRVAYALCGDWDRAEDLLQTALVKLYLAWPRVHRGGSENANLRRILVRANIDGHRRRSARPEVPLDVLPEVEAGRPLPVEDRAELFAALQELPLMQRRAVLLRHWLGLSVAETAADLEISEGTVKSHTSRGLAALHTRLGARDDQPALSPAAATRRPA
jgi:RNA polymerase sigma-70 factor (sigma-E family)